VDLADVQPGQKVLVHAGTDGPSSTVTQVAKHLSASVATTARTDGLGKVTDLGAVQATDFTTTDFAEALRGYDVVLDSLGPRSLEKPLTALKPGGLAISVVGPPDPAFATQVGKPLLRPLMALLSRKVRRRATSLGSATPSSS
jgi:NADPH:quinone reductase-like Zn-dependent oxidoreductase